MKVVDLDGKRSTWRLTGHINPNIKGQSKLHIKARELLKEMFPTVQLLEEVPIQIRWGTTLYLDFYIPLYQLAIEVNGEQHYKYIPHFHGHPLGFARHQQRDKDKLTWCDINEIEVVVLPFDAIDNWSIFLNEYWDD